MANNRIPNVKQPVTDASGQINKPWFDFLRSLADVPTATTSLAEIEAELALVRAHLHGNSRRDLLKALSINAPSRAVYVDVNGNDDTGDGTFLSPFATIEKGVTRAKEITNFDIAVLVGFGSYEINNPYEIPNNIFLIAWDAEGFFPRPKDTAQDLFTVGTTDPDAEVFFIGMAPNSQGGAISAVRQDGANSRVFAVNCGGRNNAGVVWDCRAGTMSLNDMDVSELDSNAIYFRSSGTGRMTIGRVECINADVTTVFSVTGASASMDVFGPVIIDATNSTITTAARSNNGAQLNLHNALIKQVSLGLDIDNGSTADLVAVNIDRPTTSIQVNDLNSSIRFVGSSLDKNLISFPAGYAGENMLFIDNTEGEGAAKVFGDLYTGRPERGTVLCSGNGEPATRGQVVFTTDSTASAVSDGGNITDVSAAASSFSGSTFTFQGVAANHTILFGSTLEDGTDNLLHKGIQILNSVAAVEVTPRSFTWEIWDGAAWVEIDIMAIEEQNSYRYANELFIRAGTNEHIRFDVDVNGAGTWTKKTINFQNLYWSRIRINTAITTAPVFEQARLHYNFGELAQDGTARFYGNSRFRTTLLAFGNVWGESGGVLDASIPIGSGGIPTGWTHEIKNGQINGAGDAIYLNMAIPRGICTASKLKVRVLYQPEQSGASTDASFIVSVLPIEIQGTLEADPAGGVTPVARTLANTEAVTTNTAQATTVSVPIADETKIQSFESDPIDISNYYEGDMIAIRIEGDSLGSANKDIFIWGVEMSAVQWSLGEHP